MAPGGIGNVYALDLRFEGKTLFADLDEVHPTAEAAGDQDFYIRWDTVSTSANACSLLQDVAEVELPLGYMKHPTRQGISGLASRDGYFWDHVQEKHGSAVILILPEGYTLSQDHSPPIKCDTPGFSRLSAKEFKGRIAILFAIEPSPAVRNLKTRWHMAHLGASLSAEVQRINSLASQPLPAPRRPALHPATSATIEVEGKRFDVAFSLAREQRDLIEPIALELRRQRYSVFFYAWPEHEAELAKPNLDNHLRRIYGDDARLLVPVLSADYERKPWTGVVELTVIRELIVDRRDDEIMALRTDNATVTGFSKLHGYIDVRGRSAVEIANLIGSRLGQVKLERQRVGAEQARLEEERKQDAATSAVSGQELLTFSGAPHRPPQPQITRMQDGVVHFALTKEGQFVGGTEALRRVSADILQGDWNGDLEIHHAFLDGVQQDIRDLLAHGGLSADQGKKLERLRTQASSITSGVETVCLAVKLAFVSAEGRERTWGVPMQTEETLGFLAGLFVEARLAAPSASCDVPCQLYVPRRVSDPVCIDLRLSESETKDMRELWEQELMTFPDTTWRLWDWPNLVPIWHLRDQLIAARLLPAIAISVAGRVRRSPPQTTMAGAWEDLRQVYFPTERDPLVPYHWCLALQSERSPKDLAWLTSPPHERAELHTVLGFRR